MHTDDRTGDTAEYLFTVDPDEPWHRYIPPGVLAALMAGIWLVSGPSFGGASWAVSRQSLEQGHVQTLLLHMFAHGGLLHVTLNICALLVLSPPLIKHLGRSPISYARYLYLFIGSGLSGAALFLVFHGDQGGSMLGVSGAIFGLLGALTRVHPTTGASVSILSQRTWALARLFVREHIALLILIAVAAVLTQSWVSIGWEAHLGGLLFGLLATPLFLGRHPLSANPSGRRMA